MIERLAASTHAAKGPRTMNATAPKPIASSGNLYETVAYEPDSFDREGRQRSTPGSPDMPMNNHQGNGRYTFSSGARPLDGYTIKRAIGRGGFGEVYYATSDAGKEVALKLVLKNLEVERRGVVQCMNLKCPNLVTVYDIRSNDADETFVIMEYIAGPSLANVLAQYRHGLPPAEAIGWLKGLVEGVAYLHDHGIVHRDLKPANLFMEEGMVKIGDYGLAKLITPGQGGTEHSESIGTCHYMAPEIASGKYNKPIDIYAIGVIMYEMLTGKVPFEGETVGEVLMKHLTARPDVSNLPEPFRTIVGRALSKDPNHRPARVQDLLPADAAPRPQDVRFIGDGKNGPKHPEPQKPGRKDDVFVIGEEDPVFYIGPNTKPPREQMAERLRAHWAALRRNRAALIQQRRQAMAQATQRPIRRASMQTPMAAPHKCHRTIRDFIRLLPSPRCCRVLDFGSRNSRRRCSGPRNHGAADHPGGARHGDRSTGPSRPDCLPLRDEPLGNLGDARFGQATRRENGQPMASSRRESRSRSRSSVWLGIFWPPDSKSGTFRASWSNRRSDPTRMSSGKRFRSALEARRSMPSSSACSAS